MKLFSKYNTEKELHEILLFASAQCGACAAHSFNERILVDIWISFTHLCFNSHKVLSF